MIALIVFFAFASFFYVKGVQRFMKNRSFFERVECSKYFDENTKQMAKFLQQKSIAPFFGLSVMFGMIIASFIPLKVSKNIGKNQNRISNLILYKFLEINMTATPHFYIIGILAITIRLLLSILYSLLTTNIEKIFSGFSSLPTMIFDDTSLVVSRMGHYKKH